MLKNYKIKLRQKKKGEKKSDRENIEIVKNNDI